MFATHRQKSRKCVKRFILLIIVLVQAFTRFSSAEREKKQGPREIASTAIPVEEEDEEESPVEQEESLQRLLLKVLGMEHASHQIRHLSPPEYMLDLYNTVAGSGGLTLTPNPYHANVVRSYLDRDSGHNLRFFFNVSSNTRSKKDKVLEAEFHLYKLKPRLRAKDKIKQLSSPLLEVRVYQVMYKGKKKRKKGHRLLDTRRLSVHSSGWEVFYVKAAVDDWVKDPATNFGILVTVKSMEGEVVPHGLVRFAKQHHHMVNRHPLLVLFVDDGRHAKKRYYPQTDFHTYGYKDSEGVTTINASDTNTYASQTDQQQQHSTLDDDDLEDHSATSRKQRAVGHSTKDGNNKRRSCTRNDLYVDFEKIGWSAWIISPKGYNAYYCSGDCTFPLGQNQWPTNHATVQSIVHELKLTPGVSTPCCVPNKLFSISLLYFDEHENVILKQYDDMVASSCGCH